MATEAGTRLGRVADLTLDNRLTYALGSIVRDDAFAEGEAKALFWSLQPKEPRIAMQREFPRVLADCRRLVRAAGISADASLLASHVFDMTGTAHRLRNDLAHDRWVAVPAGDSYVWSSNPLWMPKTPMPSERTLEEFTACSRALNRAGWRLRALRITLPRLLGGIDELRYIPEQRGWWLAVAQDEFTVADGQLAVTPAAAAAAAATAFA